MNQILVDAEAAFVTLNTWMCFPGETADSRHSCFQVWSPVTSLSAKEMMLTADTHSDSFTHETLRLKIKTAARNLTVYKFVLLCCNIILINFNNQTYTHSLHSTHSEHLHIVHFHIFRFLWLLRNYIPLLITYSVGFFSVFWVWEVNKPIHMKTQTRYLIGLGPSVLSFNMNTEHWTFFHIFIMIK